MGDIKGVRKAITYSDDNPVSQWIEKLREQRKAEKREPKNGLVGHPEQRKGFLQ
jgi:hypothetical protein